MLLMQISFRPGELHKVKVKESWYAGTYASVWFSKNVKFSKTNREVPNAPPYYIDFVWKKKQSFEKDKALLDEWLKKQGLYEKVAGWRSSYHIKHFYQAIVEEIDGKDVGSKYMEIWTEANWNKMTNNFNKIDGKVIGKIEVLSGLQQYKFLPVRIVGIGAVKPLGRVWILLLSNFKYQYRIL